MSVSSLNSQIYITPEEDIDMYTIHQKVYNIIITTYLKTASTASDIQLFVHGVKLTSICSELEAPTTPYLVLPTIGFKRHLKENQGTFTNETIDYFSSFWQLRCDVYKKRTG